MVRCSFMSRYGLSLLVLVYASIVSKSSSTNCKCAENIQNADCVRKPNGDKECGSVVCNDGYWGQSCQLGRLRLTSRHGYITDGAKNYTSLSKRMWLIESENSSNSSIHFEIEQLVTECNWDHLYIFDGDSIYSPQLAAFNGHFIAETNSVHAIIPQEIVAKSGKAYIYFYSDGYAEKAGFNISYSIVENCHCSSNGRCNAAGLCLCNPGWSGPICDIKWMNCTNCTNGFCNETLGYCVCDRGFTGKDCGQAVNSSYWTILNEGHTDDSVYPRASHSSVIVGNWMWVYDGFTLLPIGNTRRKHLSRYDVRENKWQDEPSDLYGTKHKWGHTMIAYKSTLIVFGGEMDKTIVRTLAKFNINSSRWDYNEQFDDAVAVTGHTATLVGNKMIVIFGLSTDGPFPKVQEYDIETSEWKIIKSESSFITARHGHTSVYDRHSKLIYVYGGMILPDGNTGSSRGSPTDSLVAYSPRKEEWISLLSSGFRQTLHSAVILDNMMLIYGGNPYVNHDNEDIRCHSSKLLTFDFACRQWKSTELPQLPQRLARYGHTATAKGRNMYIFGGFNGAFFNDVLSYTHGDCKMILNETECLEKYYSAGCYWSGGSCVNKGSLAELPECPPKHHKKCDEYKECGACTSSPFSCGWSGGACKVGGETSCPPAYIDKCSLFHNCNSCSAEGCSWLRNNKMTCRKGAQITDCPKKSCANRLEFSTCLDDGRCLWCENLNRCIESNLYLFYYQYGQCLEWTNSKMKNQAATCTSKANCQDCYSLPGCGWCEGPKRNGAGRCLDGGGSGPNAQARCKDNFWHFIECPICQCNGHGNCSSNSSVCLSCTDNTIGKNCESCAPGYFGDPSNGGLCKPCQCNGHADKCDSSSGVCSCRMRGVEGDHCDSCSQAYTGNATNGGSCYYTLQADYLYKINVSDKTIFNFICSPEKSDRDTTITVDVTENVKGFPAMLNISVESDIKNEVVLLTNIELVSQYQEQFSKDSFDFASNNFHFKIYVYDIKPFSSVSISVHQPNEPGINLLQFFIIFLACFIGLLILAVVFWKVKASYDAFRSTRRRNVELVYMTNRPFASVPVYIEKAESIPMKNKPSPLTSEICCGNKAAIVTVLFRMPLCAQKQSASETGARAGALCLGSTLVSMNEHHGSRMINYMKTVKRRRNPFRSSPT